MIKFSEKDRVKGISIINPDEVEESYYNRCIDYAIENSYNHIQITGPIHNPVKGNIDGMTLSRKYAQFNSEKDAEYVKMCMSVVNAGLERTHSAGIETFMWHHELDLPMDFGKAFPEVLNENGDVEVSHPLVQDYLENKIADFFDAYPKMDGIILTLHETKIPLLKLKNQKLDKIARVKHVTKVLFDACSARGKKMIVRPFASLQKDQELMLEAFAEISQDLIIMDKWTKFDWSLSLPDNDFFGLIKQNPFVVETDVFGEYFGKGRLPIMFKEHIEHKYEHCQTYENSGFVNRIDRNYQNPFDSVNEVNLVVIHALLNGLNVDERVANFFRERYGKAWEDVYRLMNKTEANQKKIFYLDGYYFTQGSYFPDVNHSKNHFFFEIMKDEEKIASNEWFIPVGWKRKPLAQVLEEKSTAETEAEAMFNELLALEGKMDDAEYRKLYVKFRNLYYVSKLWKHLAYAIYNCTKYFEKNDKKFKRELVKHYASINKLNKLGKKELDKDYYNYYGCRGYTNSIPECGGDFVKSMKLNFKAEEKVFKKLSREQGLTDYVICGGFSESHELQKEVNFSDTMIINGQICRIPGNRRKEWSQINAHGWFSYAVKVKKNRTNQIEIEMGSSKQDLNVLVTIGDKEYKIQQPITGKKTFAFTYLAEEEEQVRIKIDRIDGATPYVFTIKSK